MFDLIRPPIDLSRGDIRMRDQIGFPETMLADDLFGRLQSLFRQPIPPIGINGCESFGLEFFNRTVELAPVP